MRLGGLDNGWEDDGKRKYKRREAGEKAVKKEWKMPGEKEMFH